MTPSQVLHAHGWRLKLGTLALAMACWATTANAAPPDGGIKQLQTLLAGKVIGLDESTVPLPRPGTSADADVARLLQSPLTGAAAVQIALLNNPGLQKSLGKAGTSITDAARASNPQMLQAAQDVTVLSAAAYKRWVQAVAAAQSLRLQQEIKDTAQTTRELTRRMAEAGNVNRLALARAQDALSQATLALARAQQTAFAAREALVVVLGLWGEQTRFELAASLPALPAQARDLQDVEARVLASYAPLAIATAQWQLKLAGPPPSSANALWDAMGDAAAVRAMAVQARSDARQTYHDYRLAFDMARHLSLEALPVRQLIQDELVLRYNGMLTPIFDVLTDSQTLASARIASVQAERDFWLAHADLQALLAGAPRDLLTDSGSPFAGAGSPAEAGKPPGH